MKKLLTKLLLPIITIGSSITPVAVSLASCNNNKNTRLTRDDWNEQTKNALNQALDKYGKNGKFYSKDNYAVFDFDDTTAIFDVQYICTVYQIETMAYNLSKVEMEQILSTGIGDITRSLSGYDFRYCDLINDIVTCYGNLITKYGPFNSKGISDSKLSELHQENDWKDFSSKLRYMYSVVSACNGDEARGKWSTYQFSGMTPDEVYDLEKRCLISNQSKKSYYETWTSVTKITNSNTKASTTFIQGISVTENIKELYKALYNNGINVWIVSASQIDQIRAAADTFGLGQYVTGAIALTNKVGTEGKYIPEYDETGRGYIKKDGKWVRMETNNPYQTRGVGKALTIEKTIAPNYNNHGPIMCFGDSSGDFNFCTEFKDTKLVVCFNRANRSVNDGGGLMAAIAMYQKLNDVVLEKTIETNDTLYCLQGRDENTRTFRNSNKTIRLDCDKEQLFLNEANYTLLSYIMSKELSISEACGLSIKQTIAGIYVGFLDEYKGYHTR